MRHRSRRSNPATTHPAGDSGVRTTGVHGGLRDSWARFRTCPNRLSARGLLTSVEVLSSRHSFEAACAPYPHVIEDDSFSEAVSPHLEKMARVAARLAGIQDRDDVVQDALLEAWRHRRQFDPERGTMSAWILAITAHQATKLRRRALRRIHRSPEIEARDADIRIDLAGALARLTARERLAVDCYYYAGLSISETASVMRCSEGTVKSTLASARDRLRQDLAVKNGP
jgi:RNA polymerase sigma factor (sigma-70 family)